MRFRDKKLDAQTVSVASAMVRTKMCPSPVRLVVKRTKPKKGKPYRYFMVYTTDLQLAIETILRYYRLRWELETAFRDTKQNFGFDSYQVKSQKSISRFVQLSFVAASLAQWLFVQPHSAFSPITLDNVLNTLGLHWYHPKKLTRGLMQAYLRYLFCLNLFSATKVIEPFSQKIGQQSDEASSL